MVGTPGVHCVPHGPWILTRVHRHEAGVDPLAFAGVGAPTSRAEMFLPCGPTTPLLREPGALSNGSLALIQWRISLNSNTHATVYLLQRRHPSTPVLGPCFWWPTVVEG